MSEQTETDYLSIGEVLGLLLEEFPDVTISKIRFLESQGLIDPERTASGYRKFYEADVDRLRVILREQRENYLPLRVIKDRLDSGEIDPSGPAPRPAPTPEQVLADPPPPPLRAPDPRPTAVRPAETPLRPAEAPPRPTEAPLRPVTRIPRAAEEPRLSEVLEGILDAVDPTPVTPQLLPGVLLDRTELCAMLGMTEKECLQLEEYGVLTGRGAGPTRVFAEDAVEIGRLAVDLMRMGVDARHLRGWLSAADREASVYEQLVTPRLRQRNPQARAEALDQLRRLDDLGARLRTAMMRRALRHHFDS